MRSAKSMIGTLALTCCLGSASAEIDPQSNRFYFRDNNPFPDETLGCISLYLIQQKRLEGNSYVSQSVEEGIVSYQIRFFDNGNKNLIDEEDKISIRRYTLSTAPDPSLPDPNAPPLIEDEQIRAPSPPQETVETRYIEYVDHGLNGLDEMDYYFLNGRRFDLRGIDQETIQKYRSQVATAINVFLEKVDYNTILAGLGSSGQTSIRKGGAFDNGSLPSQMIFGLDLPYVFKPIIERDVRLKPPAMTEEIRKRIGFVYSATVSYTDLGGYRFRDIADQIPLLQREYDESERTLLMLIVGALFDIDGDGLIAQENISNGYKRFRQLHQQLSDNARAQGRRVILPNEKLAMIRQEYESVHQKPFSR